MTALVNWHGLQADPDNLPLPRPGVYRTEHIASGRSYVGASQNVEARVRSHVAGCCGCCGGLCCAAGAQKPCKIKTVAVLRIGRRGGHRRESGRIIGAPPRFPAPKWALTPPAILPCAGRRNKWLRTMHGSLARPSISRPSSG